MPKVFYFLVLRCEKNRVPRLGDYHFHLYNNVFSKIARFPRRKMIAQDRGLQFKHRILISFVGLPQQTNASKNIFNNTLDKVKPECRVLLKYTY